MALIRVNYLSKALYRIVPMKVILPADKFDSDTNEYLQKKDRRYKSIYRRKRIPGFLTFWRRRRKRI